MSRRRRSFPGPAEPELAEEYRAKASRLGARRGHNEGWALTNLDEVIEAHRAEETYRQEFFQTYHR